MVQYNKLGDVYMIKIFKKYRELAKAILFLMSFLSSIMCRTLADAESFTNHIENSSYQLNHFETVFALPRSELDTIFLVAQKYALTLEQTWLLCTIRKIENGATPREFGVLTPQAMRFTDSERSFFCQAEWCAGTIKKRFKGDLLEFANRYCPPNLSPLNQNWYRNALYYMRQLGAEVHPMFPQQAPFCSQCYKTEKTKVCA